MAVAHKGECGSSAQRSVAVAHKGKCGSSMCPPPPPTHTFPAISRMLLSTPVTCDSRVCSMFMPADRLSMPWRGGGGPRERVGQGDGRQTGGGEGGEGGASICVSRLRKRRAPPWPASCRDGPCLSQAALTHAKVVLQDAPPPSHTRARTHTHLIVLQNAGPPPSTPPPTFLYCVM